MLPLAETGMLLLDNLPLQKIVRRGVGRVNRLIEPEVTEGRHGVLRRFTGRKDRFCAVC
jgi:hypothetical protein